MPNHYMPNINIFILARPYILTPLSPPPPPSYTHKNVHARTHTRAHKPIQSCIIAVDTSGLVCVWDTVSAAQITWWLYIVYAWINHVTCARVMSYMSASDYLVSMCNANQWMGHVNYEWVMSHTWASDYLETILNVHKWTDRVSYECFNSHMRVSRYSMMFMMHMSEWVNVTYESSDFTLQCVAVWCSVLRCVAVCCSDEWMSQCHVRIEWLYIYEHTTYSQPPLTIDFSASRHLGMNSCISISTYMYIHIDVCIYIYLCIYVYIHMQEYISICIYVWIYIYVN